MQARSVLALRRSSPPEQTRSAPPGSSTSTRSLTRVRRGCAFSGRSGNTIVRRRTEPIESRSPRGQRVFERASMAGMIRFSDLSVCEIAGSDAGAYAAKLFADLGARVVRMGPALEPSASVRERAVFAYFNTSKRLRTVDVAGVAGRAEIRRRMC